MRSILTALGVFWGIFMLVFLLGMGKGLENGVVKDFGSEAKNIMMVWAQRTSMPYHGFKSGRQIQLKIEDLEALKAEIPELKEAAPRKTIGPYPVIHKDIQEDFEIRGEFTSLIDLMALVLYRGRYINKQDLQERRKVAVIGSKVKEVLFSEETAIGKHIRVKGVDFKVVGIFGPQQVKDWTQSDLESVVIPFTTMSQTYGTNDELGWVVCQPIDGVPVSRLENKIRTILKQRHHISPEDPDGIGGFNLEERFKQVQSLFLGIKLFLWFVGIGTLIAGIVGVSNIMLIIVKERTKEIGIRKAMGATPGSIINMILTESVFITTISGYMGLALGTILIGLINYIMVANDMAVPNFYNPEVNLGVGLFSLVVLVISGTLAGLIPALQAAKVNPVEALKDE